MSNASEPYTEEVGQEGQSSQKLISLSIIDQTAAASIDTEDTPDDIWLLILSFTTPQDILRIGRCSKRFLSLIYEDNLWESFYIKARFPINFISRNNCYNAYKMFYSLRDAEY